MNNNWLIAKSKARVFGESAIGDGVRLKASPEGCAELSRLWKPNCTIERVQSLLLARFGGLMQSWTTNL